MIVPLLFLLISSLVQGSQAAPATGDVEKDVEAANEVAPAKNQKAASSKPLASIEDILKIRDPFRGPALEGDGLGDEMGGGLESFPASDFKLLGVVTGPKRFKAMVLAPNGKTYFVATKDHIGIRKGTVERILSDRLIVRERVTNLIGQEEHIFTAIVMNKDRLNPEEKITN